MDRRGITAGIGATVAVLAAVGVAVIGYSLLGPADTVVFDRTGEFGRVRVMDERDGVRTLRTGEGRARQTAMRPGRPDRLESAYTQVSMIGLALAAPDARLLFVGLGGGAMPTYARHVRPAARIEAVEIDPLIVAVARRWFGFREDDAMTVHTGDGRAFIEQASPSTWDVVFLDAFSDDDIPYSLATREFLLAVRRVLAQDGVVVSNLWTANPLHASMVATYADVFDEVHLIRVADRRQHILVAAAGGRRLDRQSLASAARRLAAGATLGFDLTAMVDTGYEAYVTSGAPILYDDKR
jgi:spermidine synthase